MAIYNGTKVLTVVKTEGVVVDSASEVSYDNTESGLEATSVQGAIDELQGAKASVEEVSKKADKDKYYGQMGVGMADNLASPDGVVNEEPYVFRSTAGSKSVSNGYATIKSIKGNSIIVNQLLTAPSIQTQTVNGVTLTNNGDGTLTLSGKATSDITFELMGNLNRSIPLGNKVLISNFANPSRTTYYLLDAYDSNVTDNLLSTPYGYIKSKQGSVTTISPRIYIMNGATINETIKPIYVNLTKMNIDHITTIAEFNNLTRNIDTETYNEGTIIHSLPTGIKTVGFNAFNGELEIGGINGNTGLVFDSDFDIRSVNFIKVVAGQYYTLSETFENITTTVVRYVFEYDKNKNFIKRTIFGNSANSTFISNLLSDNTCYVKIGYSSSSQINITNVSNISFHLTWSGYRDGEYEEHWEQTREIDVATYFPDGMKRVGDVYDEMTPTKAIRRIGVRDYQEGDENDTSVMTDMTNTYYVLETPIETDIPQTKDINWSYLESDFGTEEFILEEGFEAPMGHETFYMANLRDEVRNLPTNYISKASFDNFITALSGALGISITSTYNEETKCYDFTIVEATGE